MNNIILFLNAFLSYLLVFVLIIALVVVACILGARWRKSKDLKLLQTPGADGEAVDGEGNA